ncbi:hypothetical protein [uncultured Brachyspira sp.]|uniref:hypothetical protein n=1 Tax=uncultured Brachyspira sp. TaxID=221953 RepID=UPI0026059562|nr:hypothetical protein [uncultured Brachyspira sp.]
MKKFINKIFITALITLFAVSCGNSPTNPSNGGNGGGGANPTPNEFVDKLKSIGIVKAGEQEWDFRTLSQSGNVLTVRPMNNAKSGTLEGLDRYLRIKIDEITEVFKYEIEFLTADSTSSDGSEHNSPANSEALEAKITFEDKKTGSPITDAEFKDGFILKVEANANWIPTPEVTEEDYKKSINQLGTINVNGKSGNTFAMDFAGLNVTKDQYQYTTELTIDANGKTDTIDLLNFIEAIKGQISKSKTEYIEISDVYISSDNSFSINFNAVSANKVLSYPNNITLKVNFINGNLSFAKRDLTITINSTPEIVTDNRGEYKSADFNISTDAENISFQSTSIVEKTSTGIKIDYVSAHYSKKDGSATIGVSGDDILNAHKILTAGQTAEFEITFTARAEGYNDKTDVKVTLKIRKGDDLPDITLDEFNTWLNTIEVSGFTKQVGSAAVTLTASSDTTPDTALKTIKDALKKLSKDKIIIDDYNIDYLSWSTFPTGNNDGFIGVYIEAAEGYAFSDELYTILTANGSARFTITVKAASSWPSNISIEGAGSSSSNPLTVNLGDGSTDVQVPYKIKFINGASDSGYIVISELKQADSSIADSWNLVGNQFFNSPNYSAVLEIWSYQVQNIINDQNIAKDSSQVYKVTLTVRYSVSTGNNSSSSSAEEDIDLYVKLVKDYAVIDGMAMIKILLEGISGQPYDGVSSVSININDNAAMNITSPYYYGNNFTATDYNVSGQGSITYINNNIRLDNIKNALAKVGLNCTMASLTFAKKSGDDTTATAFIDSLSKLDGYIFSDNGTVFDPSAGITIELTTSSQTWLD